MGTELRRRSRLPSVCVALGFILLAFVGTLFVGSAGGPVHAQESDAPQSITGRVQNRSEQDGERVTEPVPDVRVVAEDESGAEVGESVTDADGVYLIPIEQPGTYVVRIDTETLPEGLTVEEGKEQQTVDGRREPERHAGLLPRRGPRATCRASGACCRRRWPTA